MSVLTPTGEIDPRIALTTSVYAAPGVYALLLGSGISSEAGIPTGWAVTLDLIRMIARADGVELGDSADMDTERWFAQRYGADPRYDDLLTRLAGTDLARRELLRQYFEPLPGAGAIYEPTSAHNAIAQLCAEGRVRVLLTTNFDHLLERALQEAGVEAQILISESDIRGMTPLEHAAVTIIKLHGDYRGTMLNTRQELGAYRPDLRELLAEVLDRHGLVVAGWSAEWDTALLEAIKGSPGRRYPAYWVSYCGDLTTSARELIGSRGATVIDSGGASEFFVDLDQRLKRLETAVTRRKLPPLLWTHRRSPQAQRMNGWANVPLLWIRTVTELPAALEDCAPITPVERHAIVAALESSELTSSLNTLAGRPALSAEALQTPPITSGVDGLGPWQLTPDGRQSDIQAGYRLGGDAVSGVSCLVNVQLPNGGHGGSVLFTVDIGLSLSEQISVTDAATVWIESLTAAAILLPGAVVTATPADAVIEEAELHLFASGTDGNQLNRPNPLAGRIDLGSLGDAAQGPPDRIGVAMRIAEPLTKPDIQKLVIAGIERMALRLGILDPTDAIRALLAQFEV